MKSSRTKSIREAAFDLTPMIDVVLLLIIFFMLSSQFAQASRRPIDVPQEQGEKSASESPELTLIDIDGPDRYYVLGRSLSLAELIEMVKADLKRRGTAAQPEFMVRADRNSPASELNKLATALTQIGVRSWKLATVNSGGGGGGVGSTP